MSETLPNHHEIKKLFRLGFNWFAVNNIYRNYPLDL